MEYSDLVKSMKGMPLQLGKQSISLQSQSENFVCYFVQRKLPEIFQTTTVVEFQSTFEEVMNNETWISEPLRISLFISGLKPELRRKLLFNRPASLMEAYSLARAYGARMDETKNSSPSEVLSCTSANFFVTQSMKIEETQLGARSGLCAGTKSIPRFSQAYSTQLNPNSQPIIQNLTSGNPNTPAINPKNSPSAIKSETQDCPINTPKHSHQTTLLPANNLSVHRLSMVELCEIKEKSDTLYTNYDQNHSPIHKCQRRFPLSLGIGDNDRDYSNHQSKWVPPVNVGGLENVLKAYKETNTIEKIIYTSSFFALGSTDGHTGDETQVHPAKYFCTEYEKSKAIADKIALDAAAKGVPIVLLCPGVIYGPGKLTTGNSLANLLVERFNGRMPGYAGQEKGFSFCHVDDVVQGHIAAMTKGQPGERYLLTGENASFKDVFDIAAEITQTAKPWFRLPLFLLQAYGWLCVLFSRITGKLPLISPPAVNVLRHKWAYTCEKAKKELDYNPRSLKEGLTEMLPWLKSLGLIKY